MGTAWKNYSEWSDSWLEFSQAVGNEEVLGVYEALRSGQPDPKLGYICSLPNEETK
jgi:hypothetical protein